MTIKTVLFDAGNTLLTPAIPESQVLSDAAASLGVSIDAAVIEKHIPAMYEYYEVLFARDNSVWADDERAADIWMEMYVYLCELVGIPEIGTQVARIGYETYKDPRSWTIFDDVMLTINALQSQQIAIGIISNWDSTLASIIQGLGMTHHFDVIITSAVVGLHKPQQEIFKLALRELGAKGDETMYVGDHIHADARGSAGAGLLPVLIDRDNQHKDSEGFIRIQNLHDLLKYL